LLSSLLFDAQGLTLPVQASLLLPSFPKVFERFCAKLAVMGSVFDVRMAQPQLQPPRIMPCISEEMPACMPQHMRVSIRKPRSLSRSQWRYAKFLWEIFEVRC
jgi:hypothetical protein